MQICFYKRWQQVVENIHTTFNPPEDFGLCKEPVTAVHVINACFLKAASLLEMKEVDYQKVVYVDILQALAYPVHILCVQHLAVVSEGPVLTPY